jgi:hypothetical protein
VIVRAMIEHIAKVGGRANASVTTDDIFSFCRHYGMSWDESVTGTICFLAAMVGLFGCEQMSTQANEL